MKRTLMDSFQEDFDLKKCKLQETKEGSNADTVF